MFLYSSNIYEILLYNRQLVVITYELIHVVRAAHCWGKIFVKWVYCVIGNESAWWAIWTIIRGIWSYPVALSGLILCSIKATQFSSTSLKQKVSSLLYIFITIFSWHSVGIVFVDSITSGSDAVVKSNISCNPWRNNHWKVWKHYWDRFPHCYFHRDRYYYRYKFLYSSLWNVFALIVF